MNEVRLEAILIGNAAAALQVAPVTTIDFHFRKNPQNLKLYRLVREDDGLQADFMATIHGVRSYPSLRATSDRMDFGGHSLLVATLAAIIQEQASRQPPARQGGVSYSGNDAR